jgi:tetratricopeptide (TPR) repeat protein
MAANDLINDEHIKVRKYLIARFRLSDLRILADDSGIEPDNLPNDTLAEFAQELIKEARRRPVIITLLKYALEQRPDDEIEQIYQRLLQSTESPHLKQFVSNAQRLCPAPPAPPTHFGGRDTQKTKLSETLKAGQTAAIVAVAGLGGIGKTTLARKLANELYQQKIFRAVLWADIGKEPQILTLLQNWATYAEPTFQPGDRSLTAVAWHVKALLEALIAEKCQECIPARTLVVLDDVWDNGLETIRILKEACPADATILITSRSHNVAANLGANIQTLDRLAKGEAVDLLAQYLPTSDPIQLAELGQVLGGHPLALTLAAKRIIKAESPIRALPIHLKEYRTKLPTGIEFQHLRLDQAAGREDNLTLILSYSYNDLTEPDQARFRALGALAYDQPFDRDIVAALWQLDDIVELENACDNLRLLSLLEVDYSFNTTENADSSSEDTNNVNTKSWYRQHPLLQTYAHALLLATNAENEVQAVERRYQNYVVEKITPKFEKFPPETWSQELTPYLPHIHSVGDQLVKLAKVLTNSSQPDLILPTHALTEAELLLIQHFAINTSRYLELRLEVKQLDWLEMGLNSSRALTDQQEEARFLDRIGTIYAAWGDKTKALEYFNQALPMLRLAGDKQHEVITLNNIGRAHYDLGDKTKALQYHTRALPLSQAIGDKRREAVTFNNIGAVYKDLGNNRKALEYFDKALLLFRIVGDKQYEATALNNIGAVYKDLGNNRKALEYFTRALSLHQMVSDKYGEAATLNNMGVVYKDLGEKHKALDYYELALPLSQTVGDKPLEATALGNIGTVYYDLGNKTKTLYYCNLALLLFRAVSDKQSEADILMVMGKIHAALGNKHKALDYYEQALAPLRALGKKGNEAATLNNLAAIYMALGDKRKALDYYEQALAPLRGVKNKASEATTLDNIGTGYAALGDNSNALKYYAMALPLFRETKNKRGEAATKYNISQSYYRMGELKNAIRYLGECIQIQVQLKHSDLKDNQNRLAQWQQELKNKGGK